MTGSSDTPIFMTNYPQTSGFCSAKLSPPPRPNSHPPQGGGTRSIHDGGSDVFFWIENLHARYFFGSRDLSRIFLGLKKIRIFFGSLSSSELFVSGFRCDQWIRKIFIRTFFQRRVFRVLVFVWVGNFDARYFFGSKISGLCIFLGLQYEAPSDPPPPVMYTSSTPLGLTLTSSLHIHCVGLSLGRVLWLGTMDLGLLFPMHKGWPLCQ